jgi:hypothetical protein
MRKTLYLPQPDGSVIVPWLERIWGALVGAQDPVTR